ncbi:MAG: pyridoxamine 5'-phosphate oxidase family protein [Nitriliruptorales bacterium]
MSWNRLETDATELADFGARRLTEPGVAYLATVGEDGAPRVHPVTPILAPGHLFVFMEPTSPKGRDLERGSRYALHCSVEDSDGGGGEFRVAGPARRIDDRSLRELATEHSSYSPADRYVLFELLVEDAFSKFYGDDGTPILESWTR